MSLALGLKVGTLPYAWIATGLEKSELGESQTSVLKCSQSVFRGPYICKDIRTCDMPACAKAFSVCVCVCVYVCGVGGRVHIQSDKVNTSATHTIYHGRGSVAYALGRSGQGTHATCAVHLGALRLKSK